MPLQIRTAERPDIPVILHFIRGLAEYEKLLDAAVATEAQLAATLFGERPYAEVLLAELDGAPAGFALFFHNYSTFLAKPGIYLEDLFVEPPHRGKGLGKALLKAVAKLAIERECARVEWSVLNWNEPSIQFYKSLGAETMDEWTVYRLQGKTLQEMVAS